MRLIEGILWFVGLAAIVAVISWLIPNPQAAAACLVAGAVWGWSGLDLIKRARR